MQSVSCHDVGAKAPEFWHTVEREDERRHQWMMNREAEAIRRIEDRLANQNRKILAGEFATARLGHVAHERAQIADCRQKMAIKTELEMQAEEYRNAGERAQNWARFAVDVDDRDTWRLHHYYRLNASAAGSPGGAYFTSIEPQILGGGAVDIVDKETEDMVHLQTASNYAAMRVFTNSKNNWRPMDHRPKQGFHGHVSSTYQ